MIETRVTNANRAKIEPASMIPILELLSKYLVLGATL